MRRLKHSIDQGMKKKFPAVGGSAGANKSRSHHDLTLLALLLIRDEVGVLKRPSSNRFFADIRDSVNAIGRRVKGGPKKTLVPDVETLNFLIDRLEDYERVIGRIDAATHNALMRLDVVSTGGRPRGKGTVDQEVKDLVVQIANEYLIKHGRYPSIADVHKKVRLAYFKKSPKAYIKALDLDLTKQPKSEVDDPSWAFWQSFDGIISESTVRNILKSLKANQG